MPLSILLAKNIPEPDRRSAISYGSRLKKRKMIQQVLAACLIRLEMRLRSLRHAGRAADSVGHAALQPHRHGFVGVAAADHRDAAGARARKPAAAATRQNGEGSTCQIGNVALAKSATLPAEQTASVARPRVWPPSWLANAPPGRSWRYTQWQSGSRSI